jgi:hypothetical protein
MTQNARPIFELILGEVSLRAPETPLYLALAAQVLEVRRQELQDGVAVTFPAPVSVPEPVGTPAPAPANPPAPTQEVTESVTQPTAVETPAPVTAVAPPAPVAAATPPARRARWFHDQFPQVTFEDGSTQVIPSLNALKELLRNRGLQPHPRGDASMLLWQVRNRLGLTVEQVTRS